MDSGGSSNGCINVCLCCKWQPNSVEQMVMERHKTPYTKSFQYIRCKVKTVSRWSKSATGCGVTWSVVRVRAPQISRSHSGPVSPLLLSTALREQGGRSELGTSTSTLQAHIQPIHDYMMTGPFIPTYVA